MLERVLYLLFNSLQFKGAFPHIQSKVYTDTPQVRGIYLMHLWLVCIINQRTK